MDNKYTLIRQIEKEIKLGIIFIDILMTLYVLWLIITDDSSWLFGLLFGFTPFGAFELFRAGKLFNFCMTHKLMLIHTLLVYCCCIYQAYIGFGCILYFMRWVMFLFGVLLFISILLKVFKIKVSRIILKIVDIIE